MARKGILHPYVDYPSPRSSFILRIKNLLLSSTAGIRKAILNQTDTSVSHSISHTNLPSLSPYVGLPISLYKR